jgi:hypothetical protein
MTTCLSPEATDDIIERKYGACMLCHPKTIQHPGDVTAVV